MFGTLAVYTGGGYPADAEAVTDCVEISWPAATMTELMLRWSDRAGPDGSPRGRRRRRWIDYGFVSFARDGL
jgi:hypothetical protein